MRDRGERCGHQLRLLLRRSVVEEAIAALRLDFDDGLQVRLSQTYPELRNLL
jgi:hypothetical protein